VRGERTNGSKLRQAPSGFLDSGGFLGPHQRRPRGASEGALLAAFAALGFER